MATQQLHQIQPNDISAIVRPRRYEDLVESYEPSAHGGYRARTFIEEDEDDRPFGFPDGNPRELRFD